VLTSKIMTNKFIGEATYIVPPEEVERYKRQLGDKYEVLPCTEEGIAKTRHWIGRLAKKRGEAKFCMMDDDLNFAVRKSVETYNLRPCTPVDIKAMLTWIEDNLTKYAHVSVSPRANNAGVPRMKSGTVETLVMENKRTLRVLAYRTDEFLSVKHGRVPVMEDFDVNLQLLRSGRPNLLSYHWANDQRETGSLGGCFSYRTLEAHNAAARKLVELHAPFVELREKINKAAMTKAAESLRTRLEVTIQWNKAFESSQGGE